MRLDAKQAALLTQPGARLHKILHDGLLEFERDGEDLIIRFQPNEPFEGRGEDHPMGTLFRKAKT